MAKKKIRIECEGAATVKLDDLIELQGDLKDLTEENYEKMKRVILELGFSFPVHAWKNDRKVFIIDAHQRKRTLTRMRDQEGYEIPPLPVVWVKAKDRAEAGRKILAAASQYGEVTSEGLYRFMHDFKIQMPELHLNVRLPEIDLKKFDQGFFGEPESVNFTVKPGAKELSSADFAKFEHECPKCGHGWD